MHNDFQMSHVIAIFAVFERLSEERLQEERFLFLKH